MGKNKIAIEKATQDEYENEMQGCLEDVLSDMQSYKEDYTEYLTAYNYLLEVEYQHKIDQKKHTLKYFKEDNKIWYKKNEA